MARPSLRILALLALPTSLLAACVAPQARADGDPASDVLYSTRVFYSWDKPPSASAQQRLNGVVAAATRAGYPIRVALIASPGDLGAVTALWGKPRQYARFLGTELTLAYEGSLVVVMPSGLGYYHVGHSPEAAYGALRPVRVETGGDGLADAAVEAVAKLAAAGGRPVAIPAPAVKSGSDTSGGDRLTIGLAGALLLLAVVGYVIGRRRQA